MQPVSFKDIQAEVLLSTTLPAPARAVLYTVNTGNLAEIQKITLINTSGVQAIVNLFIVYNGLDVRLTPFDYIMDPGDMAELVEQDTNGLQPMTGGDTIEAVSDVAGVEINVVGFPK
jgi:hypothetical protein